MRRTKSSKTRSVVSKSSHVGLQGPSQNGLIRFLKPAMDQADEFFKNGDIKPFCDGPCNPT